MKDSFVDQGSKIFKRKDRAPCATLVTNSIILIYYVCLLLNKVQNDNKSIANTVKFSAKLKCRWVQLSVLLSILQKKIQGEKSYEKLQSYFAGTVSPLWKILAKAVIFH